MHILGLVGGVASGKSLVARLLAERGAVVLDADRGGHEVLQLPEVEAAARARWGERVFGPDGKLDRAGLAKVVFAPPPDGPRERAYLEKLTHPRIAARLLEQAQREAAAGRTAAVLDAPLLLEAGWDKLCTKVIFVDAPRDVRLQRATDRGWTAEQFAAREAAQMPVDEKRRRADWVIDNGGDEQRTREQVDRIWEQLAEEELLSEAELDSVFARLITELESEPSADIADEEINAEVHAVRAEMQRQP